MINRRRLLAGATAALAVVAATVFGLGTANAESNGGVRVMPLGDSITDGLTVPGGYRIDLWQKLVAGGYTVDFVGSLSNGPANLGDHDHEGHSGWTIAQIDANVVNWLRTYNPRTILLHIGTNDIYGSDPAGAPARLSTLIDHITAQSPNTELFVATIIPLGFSDSVVRAYNAQIPGIVQSRASAGKHVHLVEMYSALTTADLADGVHPNAVGYGKMANVWYSSLLSVPGSLSNDTPPTTAAPTTAAPTTAPPTTVPPTTAPPTSGAGCSASVSLNSWTGGFVATVRVTAGSAAVSGWSVTMTLPSGASVTNAWNADRSGSSGTVQFTNVSYNGSIAAGQYTEFGFQGVGSGGGMTPTCTAR